ncbi:hypothetical protein ACJX0J_020699 [Zea mays]
MDTLKIITFLRVIPHIGYLSGPVELATSFVFPFLLKIILNELQKAVSVAVAIWMALGSGIITGLEGYSIHKLMGMHTIQLNIMLGESKRAWGAVIEEEFPDLFLEEFLLGAKSRVLNHGIETKLDGFEVSKTKQLLH